MSLFRRVAATGWLVLLLVSAIRAGAQGDARQLPATLQPTTRAAIVSLGDSLTSEHLPSRPLYDKAAEGHLKGANDAQILVAVRNLAQRLRQARATLGPTAREVDVVAATSALSVGIAPELLRRLASAREARVSGPSLALAFTVLTDLASREVPADIAAQSVESLLTRGARDLDLSELLRTVDQDIRSGRRPIDALKDRTQGVLRAIEQRRPY